MTIFLIIMIPVSAMFGFTLCGISVKSQTGRRKSISQKKKKKRLRRDRTDG